MSDYEIALYYDLIDLRESKKEELRTMEILDDVDRPEYIALYNELVNLQREIRAMKVLYKF